MKHLTITWVAALLTTAFALTLYVPTSGSSAKAQAAQAYQPTNPCAAPNYISQNPAQTAWQLWVAATCPVNQSQYPYVVWENWIEQAQMYPSDPSQGLTVPNSGGSLARFICCMAADWHCRRTRDWQCWCQACSEVPIRTATWRALHPPISRTW